MSEEDLDTLKDLRAELQNDIWQLRDLIVDLQKKQDNLRARLHILDEVILYNEDKEEED